MIRTILRRTAIALGGLVALVVVALCVVYVITQRRFDAKLVVAGHAPVIPTDTAAITRGRHVAAIGKCAECHTADFGGGTFIDVPIVARLYTANLTTGTGGVATGKTDLDWERALRHGVANDGRKLMFMPSQEFQHFNDDDLGALIAYLKSLPPVNRVQPKNSVGPIGRVLFVKGDLPLLPADQIDHAAAIPKTITPAPTLEFGTYITNVAGCKGCHGPTLSGGPIPGTPPEFRPPANITPKGIGHYTEADFITALRTGQRPKGGAMIDTVYMPVRFTKLMSDDEIRAVYMYLKTVPPKEYGGR